MGRPATTAGDIDGHAGNATVHVIDITAQPAGRVARFVTSAKKAAKRASARLGAMRPFASLQARFMATAVRAAAPASSLPVWREVWIRPAPQSAHQAPAVLARLVAVASLIMGEVGGAGEVEVGGLCDRHLAHADAAEQGRTAASARTLRRCTASAPRRLAMNCQERCSSTWLSGTSPTSTSPYWLTGSPIQRNTLRPLPVSRTSGHSTMSRSWRCTVTMASDNLARPGARWQIVIGPVPIPVECLEQLGVSAGALEQIVPFRLECIKPGPVADDRKAVRTGAGACQG